MGRKSLVPAVALALLFVFHSGALAGAARITFYDTDAATVLLTMTLTQHPPSADKYYLPWRSSSDNSVSGAGLNNVPDKVEDKVILSWKLKGDSEDKRVVLSNYATQSTDIAGKLNPKIVWLASDQNLELVPLKTVTKAEFSDAGNTVVVDGHVDTPGRMLDGNWKPEETRDLIHVNRPNGTQGLYPWLKAGGLNGSVHSAYTAPYEHDYRRGAGDRSNSRILALLNATHWSARKNPGVIKLVYTPEEFRAAYQAGLIPITQSVEGAYSITEENCEELLEQYYDLGVRLLSFTHNPSSYLAGGNDGKFVSIDGERKSSPKGMRNLGKRAVAKMDELGIVFDASHTDADPDTINAVLALTKNPIVASHSGARGQYDHIRNLWDMELVSIARSGGVVFQNFYGDYMEQPWGIYEVVNQIDYISNLLQKPLIQGGAGLTRAQALEHIGIGTDYDGGTSTADVNDARFFYKTTRELLARGYTKEEISKIYSGNAYRVLDKAKANAVNKRGGSAVITLPAVSSKTLQRGILAEPGTREPSFSANVTGAKSARVIVDGMVVPSAFSGNSITANMTGKPLQESLHVVTFEAADNQDKVTRETNIFYVGDVNEIHKVEFMNPDGRTLISTIYVASGDVIPADKIPTKSIMDDSITGFKNWWNEKPFNMSSKLTRSQRLVGIGSSSGKILKIGVKQDQDAKKFTITFSDLRLGDGGNVVFFFVPKDPAKPTVKTNPVLVETTTPTSAFTVSVPYNDLALSNGTEYIVMYKNEAGTIFGYSSSDILEPEPFIFKDAGPKDNSSSGCTIGTGLFALMFVPLFFKKK